MLVVKYGPEFKTTQKERGPLSTFLERQHCPLVMASSPVAEETNIQAGKKMSKQNITQHINCMHKNDDLKNILLLVVRGGTRGPGYVVLVVPLIDCPDLTGAWSLRGAFECSISPCPLLTRLVVGVKTCASRPNSRCTKHAAPRGQQAVM